MSKRRIDDSSEPSEDSDAIYSDGIIDSEGEKEEVIFSSSNYWESKYINDTRHFEWYIGWNKLQPKLADYVERKEHALYIGCGTSELGLYLKKSHVRNITNMDISRTVIKHMAKEYASVKRVNWDVGDVKNLQYRRNTFDLVIDKGTMDSIMCSDTAVSEIDLMLSNISKVLAPEGIFIEISSGCEELRLSYLQAKTNKWDVINVIKIPKPILSGEFYYAYVMKKKGSLGEKTKSH